MKSYLIAIIRKHSDLVQLTANIQLTVLEAGKILPVPFSIWSNYQMTPYKKDVLGEDSFIEFQSGKKKTELQVFFFSNPGILDSLWDNFLKYWFQDFNQRSTETEFPMTDMNISTFLKLPADFYA